MGDQLELADALATEPAAWRGLRWELRPKLSFALPRKFRPADYAMVIEGREIEARVMELVLAKSGDPELRLVRVE